MYCEHIELYTGRKDVILTTYVRDDSPDLLNGKPRPAVIICPGGAYLNLSDVEGEPVALAFANMGYHAFVLKYSTYFEGACSGDIFAVAEQGIKEHCLFPRPMQDIGAAMLNIRQHASEWHVNTDQIAICGFSAGAHNCAMYGVYWNKPEIADFLGVDAKCLKPSACILGYSLTDYVYMHSEQGKAKDETSEILFRHSDLAFLGTQKPDQDQLRKVSPALLVNDDTPPTFLWATSEDGLVPVQHSLKMASALADKGIPFEMHIFEEGRHGLGTASEGGAGTKWNVNADASAWVSMCHTWLKKRFTLDLPEKPFWA